MPGAVILAAGAATRMGRLKQLLPFRGRTLIENAILQAMEAEFSPVVVVLGAEADAVEAAAKRTGATFLRNELWPTGMGSSVVCGVRAILKNEPNLASLAITLADQPLVTAAHLREMLFAFDEKRAAILAALYGGTVGVPAIFRQTVFAKLLALPSDIGARALLRNSEFDVQTFELPEAAIDVDTPEDFAALG